MHTRSFVVTLLLILATPLLAQTPFGEAIEISIANLDVVVLDRHGNPVQGLTKDDFEVLEDGKKQSITNFAEYTSPDVKASPLSKPPSNASSAKAAARPPRRRFLAIVVDLQDIERIRRDQFFKGLREFIDREQRPGDETAVFVWMKRLRVVVPPTSYRAAIDTALDSFQKTDSWNEREVLEAMKAAAVEAAAEFEAAGGMSGDAAAEKEFQEMLLGEERCSYMKRKYEAMRELVTSFGSLDMQKVMIVGSDDMSIRPDPSCLLEGNVESLAAVANSYGFTIHAFHPAGVRNFSSGNNVAYRFPGPGSPVNNANADRQTFDESHALSILAKDTGGEFAVGAPLAVKALNTVATTLDNYYSIGYRLQGGRPNVARSVVVKTKDRSLTVRSRKSVVEFSDDRKINDAVVSSLYSSARPKSAIPVLAEIGNVKTNGGTVQLKITVSVPIEKLALVPDDKGNVSGRFAVYAAAGREVGDASAVSRLEQQITRPASAKIAAGERIEYTFDLVARASTRRIAVGVRDETTKEYGVATVDVRVPGR